MPCLTEPGDAARASQKVREELPGMGREAKKDIESKAEEARGRIDATVRLIVLQVTCASSQYADTIDRRLTGQKNPRARLIRSLTRTARKRLRKLASTPKRQVRTSTRQSISLTRKLRRALPRAKVGYQDGSAAKKSSDIMSSSIA
jgi:hypothetical protein